MAPRRRSTRKNPAPAARDPSPVASETSALSEAPPEAQGKTNSKDSCPACAKDADGDQSGDKDTWIQCDKCKTWFHWRCVGEGGDLDAWLKWYCKPCQEANPSLQPTLKPPARKSSRKRAQPDYANLHAGLDPAAPSNGSKWINVIATKNIKSNAFKHMKGSEVTVEWLEHDPEALREPILIEKPDGLGMRMPHPEFTVADVAEAVGSDTPVEVIDVSTQSNSPGWTLEKWSEYYSQAPGARDKIRNVISLEFSNTPLAEQVAPPRIVKDLDWVDKFWPTAKKGPGQAWPKVQMYCLMGVAHAWTDWHVDFAGSSVYYHIFKGAKTFYFIRPTAANLAAYERWSSSDMQSNTWLGDLVDEVVKVELVEGNTMIIPTGWIHAVYTPMDSLVFGGNFLHSWNVATQLRVREIEIATHVPKKFRFPLFTRLCWYAGEKYLRDLKAKEEFPSRVLESIAVLADFLVAEARILEAKSGNGALSDAIRKESKEAVPQDKVKDAPALARELRWRARNARGYTSGDEGPSKRRKSSVPANGVKRKREGTDSGEHGETENGRLIFKNWRRKGWEKEESLPKRSETKTQRRKRPTEELQTWVKDEPDIDEEMEEDQEAVVETTTEVIVKVRRVRPEESNHDVLERQRVERRVEVFKWPQKGGEAAEAVAENTPAIKEETPVSTTKPEEQIGTAPSEEPITAREGEMQVDQEQVVGAVEDQPSAEESKNEEAPMVLDVSA